MQNKEAIESLVLFSIANPYIGMGIAIATLALILFVASKYYKFYVASKELPTLTKKLEKTIDALDSVKRDYEKIIKGQDMIIHNLKNEVYERNKEILLFIKEQKK